jgi:D-alanyl-D-alanine carboxypeptidase
MSGTNSGGARRRPIIGLVAGRSILGVGMAGWLAAAALLLAAPAAFAFTPEQEQRLHQVVEDYREELQYPGLVVGVWQQGQGGFTTAVGRANIASGRSMTTRDHFAIGSVTKTMTATLMLQLVQRGKVKLTDPLSKYVSGVPLGRLITVRMLLNHTSGIHDGPSNGVTLEFFRSPRRSFSLAQLLRRPLRAPRYGLPGALWKYSNTGYWLLGKIVRQVTRKPLPTLYERRVFDRVRLGETSFRPRRAVPAPAARGYLGCEPPIRAVVASCAGRPPGAAIDTTDWNRSWSFTAGAATATLGDLRRWAPAVATGRGLLNRRTQARRLRFTSTGGPTCPPAMPPSGCVLGEAGEVRYGLGIAKWNLDPSRRVAACESETLPAAALYGHNGAIYGYDAEAWYEPESKLTIVALGNTFTAGDPLRPSRLDGLGLDGLVPCLAAAVAE